jgi:hypothetical protein
MQLLTLLFRGATVGTLHAELADGVLAGDLSPLPGFEVLRAAIGDASRALTNHGFLPPAGARTGGVSQVGDKAGAAALAAAQALCDELELRDSRGQLVPTDWINVFGGRTLDDPVSVLATCNQAPSTVPAPLPHSPGNDSGSESRAG